MNIVRTEKRERSFAGKLIKFAFIAFNLLMAIWIIGGLHSVSKIQTHTAVEQIGTGIGAAIGITVILVLWALGDLILGVLVLVTRGDKVIIEERSPAFSVFPSDSTTPSGYDLDKIDERIAQLKAQASPSSIRTSASSPAVGAKLPAATELASSNFIIIRKTCAGGCRMARLFAAAVVLCWLAGPALAAGLDAAAINNAEYRAKPAEDKIDPAVVKVQILLDRALFSPGEIDGKFAENTRKALRAFAEAKSLTFQKDLTRELWEKLMETSQGAVISQYKISRSDLKGPFLKKVPAKLEDMKSLDALGYASPREALAEKFHMSEALLSALNPGSKFDRADEMAFVADISRERPKLAVNRIEVDKTRQTVRALDQQGGLVAFFPATVGSDEKPTPAGTLKVVSSDPNPTYRYNPDYRFKGVRSKRPFTIKPGPNNPAGSHWIGLSAEGYGIHGTPIPSRVSKTESNGCVRLTNWDAVLLGSNVKKGTPVEFVEGKDERKS